MFKCCHVLWKMQGNAWKKNKKQNKERKKGKKKNFQKEILIWGSCLLHQIKTCSRNQEAAYQKADTKIWKVHGVFKSFSSVSFCTALKIAAFHAFTQQKIKSCFSIFSRKLNGRSTFCSTSVRGQMLLSCVCCITIHHSAIFPIPISTLSIYCVCTLARNNQSSVIRCLIVRWLLEILKTWRNGGWGIRYERVWNGGVKIRGCLHESVIN